MPVQELAKRPDGSHPAGHHVVAAEQAAGFGLDTGPHARADLAQRLAIESRVQPQTLGDGQHDFSYAQLPPRALAWPAFPGYAKVCGQGGRNPIPWHATFSGCRH